MLGLLVLPSSMAAFGLILGTILLIVAYMMSICGIYLLNLVGNRVGGRKVSFSEAALRTYPKAAIMFDIVLSIKCLGTAISYLKIVACETVRLFSDIYYAGTVDKTTKFVLSEPLWVLVAVLLISPVTFFKSLSGLRFVSLLGLLNALYMTTLALYRFLIYAKLPLGESSLFVPLSFRSLEAFSVFVFAFTCHHNVRFIPTMF